MNEENYLDEIILEMIDQVESPGATGAVEATPEKKRDEIPPEERTIYTGLKIEGLWIEFEERFFLGGRFAMMIPQFFTNMDEESAKIKYPMEQRPETILTDPTGAVNFLLSDLEQEITNDDAEMVRDNLLTIMRRVNPGIRPQSTGKEIIGDKNVAYVEFSNPTMDGKLYNLMFFLEAEGKALMGSFNCPTKSLKYWKKPAFEMMQSLRVIELEIIN